VDSVSPNEEKKHNKISGLAGLLPEEVMEKLDVQFSSSPYRVLCNNLKSSQSSDAIIVICDAS
jgi:hypothetical protein